MTRMTLDTSGLNSHFKAKAFREELWEAFWMRCGRLQWQEEKMNEWTKAREMWIPPVTRSQLAASLSLISLSPSDFLFLPFIPSLSASLCSFHYTVQGSGVDIWVLHRGDLDMSDCWTYITHITHTYTLWSKPWKGALSRAAGLTTHNSIRSQKEMQVEWMMPTEIGWWRVEGLRESEWEEGRYVGNAKDRDTREVKVGWRVLAVNTLAYGVLNERLCANLLY